MTKLVGKVHLEPEIVDNKNMIPEIVGKHIDNSYSDAFYNFYRTPDIFREAVEKNVNPDNEYLKDGIRTYNELIKNGVSYNHEEDRIYQGIVKEVNEKLEASALTKFGAVRSVEFTTRKTGVISKQQLRRGRRDYWIKTNGVSDTRVFYTLYINLSYAYFYSDEDIKLNGYRIYALVKQLERILNIRVIVINHTGNTENNCMYGYILKSLNDKVDRDKFIYYLTTSKRTYGWAYYTLYNKEGDDAYVGHPTNTVSIAEIDVDNIIEDIVKFLEKNK